MLELLLVLGFLAWAIWFIAVGAGDVVEGVLVAVFGTLIGLPIAVFALLGVATITVSHQHHEIDKGTSRVVALKDSESINGNFSGSLFFVSGQVGSALAVTWYQREGPGVYHPISVNSEQANIRIHEVAPDQAGRVIETIDHATTQYPWWVGNFVVFDNGTDYTYDIYAPKGTIAQDFKLNAQ